MRLPSLTPISLLNKLMNIKSNAEKTKGCFTPDELACFLAISKATVYRLVNKRQLRCVKVGGLLRFTMDDIEKYWEENRIGPINL